MSNLTALIKPASHFCNLHCDYCFYRDEINIRKDKCSMIMESDTADSIIEKVYSYCGKDSEITFMFQGGEPLIAGSKFFDNFSKKAASLIPEKSSVNFSLQTNGTLLNRQFCEIFKNYDYLIGVSVDGTENTHNLQRDNSYLETMNGISLLKEYGISFNIVTVVTENTDANELFEFYKSNGFNDVQAIICLGELNNTNKYPISPRNIARFKKRLFNKWIKEYSEGNYFSVREFENLATLYTEGKYEQCGFTGQCSPQLVIEADGTCYPCDFYCIDEFRCPNIKDISGLDEMLKCKGVSDFLKYDTPKSRLCTSCEVYDYCGGLCKRYRSLYSATEGYCPQKDYLLHALNKLKEIM